MRAKQKEIERLKGLGCSNSEARAIVDVYRRLIPDDADDFDFEAARAEIRLSAARWIADIEKREAWPGNARVARWMKGRLEKAGMEISEHSSESIYLDIYRAGEFTCEIRIADHPQPAFGGYKGAGELGDERYGKSDILVDPDHPDWREAIARVITLAEEMDD